MFFPYQSGMANEEQANLFLENDGLGAAIVGRIFVKNPGIIWQFTLDPGAEINGQTEWVARSRHSRSWRLRTHVLIEPDIPFGHYV